MHRVIPKTKYFLFDGEKVTDSKSFFIELASAMGFLKDSEYSWADFKRSLDILINADAERKVLIWIDPYDFRTNHPEDFYLVAILVTNAAKSQPLFKILNANLTVLAQNLFNDREAEN
jgi:hypothetical protein